eukprot:m.34992 g.34992  ORF g.34992 m.34992 type:complete len:59 (+) comp9975_c0_seq1:944-1120(+)
MCEQKIIKQEGGQYSLHTYTSLIQTLKCEFIGITSIEGKAINAIVDNNGTNPCTFPCR